MDRPRLIVYCGLPGVGKSLASGYTAEQLPAHRYRSDRIRKQLFPEPNYTDAETAETYETLLERARADLEAGTNVVLDATFRSRPRRDDAAAIAETTAAESLFVHVTCEEAVVEERLESRSGTVSDADYEQYLHLREAFDPLEREHVVLDNSGSIEETYRQLERDVL
ncbi:AAA family ATPase [Natrinema longum]|uniref:AAA family ATPase n=1 Tax=Natrinema longum TaxID=370324 RepID=A0A8A2UD47_9EURY|nr:AAA family ATPase [Natrinema longum]MBZ6495280.1 AAA family ATPase [Natrinema longum]QSW86741.1 AAA family ATPase [Natrinema longum]